MRPMAAQRSPKMRARRYGLVIASWDMAPITRCDFLYGLRGDPGLSRIPVVVTGNSRSDNVIAAKKRAPTGTLSSRSMRKRSR